MKKIVSIITVFAIFVTMLCMPAFASTVSAENNYKQ